MRIIAGRFRSRRIKSVPGIEVRPTPDRLRESLFSVLAPRIEGVVFLDAFAGTGAVGIEALSRGAKHAILMEHNAWALRALRENLRSLGIEDEASVVRGNAVALLSNYKADVAFVDPPYDQVRLYGESLLALSKTRCKLAIAQHPSKLLLEDRYGDLTKFRVLKQGDNCLSFYEIVAPESFGK